MTVPSNVRLVYSNDITIADLANLYLDELHQRASAAQVGWIYFHATRHRLKRICGHFGKDTPIL